MRIVTVSKIFTQFLCCYFLRLLDDECALKNNETKLHCIELNKCDWAKELLHQGKFPQTCGFNGTEPNVCCPIITKTKLKQTGYFAQKGNLIIFC